MILLILPLGCLLRGSSAGNGMSGERVRGEIGELGGISVRGASGRCLQG